MTDPDPHPHSAPDADHDRRSDLERAISGENRDIETLDESIGGVAPAAPDGAEGENGAGGVVKNQDDMAQ